VRTRLVRYSASVHCLADLLASHTRHTDAQVLGGTTAVDPRLSASPQGATAVHGLQKALCANSYQHNASASKHIRTGFNLLTARNKRTVNADNPQRYEHCCDFFNSTDPQPGVALVNPKPQCAFEELTFTKSCNSRYVSHFAAFFIDPRAE
jgi:hypothetical protein